MNIRECYQLLGLSAGATLADLKSSYRKLARRYHPDVNRGDRGCHEKFIEINQAYQILLQALESTPVSANPAGSPTASATPRRSPPPPPPPPPRVVRKEPSFRYSPHLTELEQLLKRKGYLQLQQLLKYKRFPRAIALVEALAHRIPRDAEVRQWQAIVYQRYGRYSIECGQLDKARIYLKKALKTDPHNRSLWVEVERDFRRLERVL